MASIGFSTARIQFALRNTTLKDRVCMAILEPESNGYQETLAVLVFFQTMDRGEIMMADCSEFPSYSGKADLTVVRVLRKSIPGLALRPSQLRSRIFEDVQAANGKSTSPTSRTIASEGEKKTSRLFSGMQRSSLGAHIPTLRTKTTLVIDQNNRLRATAQAFVPSYAPGPRITLSKDHPERISSPPKSNNTRRPPPPNQFKCSVFVSHIASGATWHDLQSAFSTQVAPTLRVYMKPGCSWAHVYFYDLKGVELAIEAAAAGLIKICGRPARVRRRTRKKKVKRSQQSNGSPPRKAMQHPRSGYLNGSNTSNPNTPPFGSSTVTSSLRNEWELKEANSRLDMHSGFLHHNGSDGLHDRSNNLSLYKPQQIKSDDHDVTLSNVRGRLNGLKIGRTEPSAFRSCFNQPAAVSSLFSTAPGF